MQSKRKVGGKIFHEIVDPLIPKFNLHDILQVIIGASIFAVPIGFTEETWRLGETLPLTNVIGLLFLSLLFISMFTYYHYHRQHGKKHLNEFVKRVISTYVLSFVIVALIMTIIQKAPWQVDSLIAFKRVAIVTFPSSLSAV
ncbi:MAG: DUF2391 family protein, partial [Nanoarchaeota archaeon]|nr:DUF2391 family protein [Nanoarchaeota archaeon]